MDHGLWPWGHANRRREDAAFFRSAPFQGANESHVLCA
jgi:hypothetical protein